MATKVLIVLDGGYRFARTATPAGTPNFTYETLVNALTGAGMIVTKAHRAADDTATMGFELFRFDALPAGFSLNDIDVIWLIGLNGRTVQGDGGTTGALSDPQINVIADFMDAGGGVFATGDHFSLGAELSGKIPRVRAMRCWYGEGDTAGSHMPAGFPRNFPPLTVGRADTTRTRSESNYTEFSGPFVWFENQSDSNPQTITPSTTIAHSILRKGDENITVYPDHMHEGQTLGETELDAIGYAYDQNSPYGDTSEDEFRELAGAREKPKVIATGQTEANASRDANTGGFSFGSFAGADAISSLKTVNTLSTYDGRAVGVGRIVTGATFHHYVDINLTGDSDVATSPAQPLPALNPIERVGADAQKDHGFNDNPAVFADIKQVFVNITNWLAKPRPAITLYLERSTFGQDEVTGEPLFGGVIRVAVDGLKPSDFPGGPVTTGPFNPAWAPVVTAAAGFISITPTAVFSDDPTMPERLQRFTFIYDVDFSSSTFGDQVVAINASLNSPVAPAPLTDTAFFQLVTSANPFMLDLDGGNDTHWLSSDLKVFPVVAGDMVAGITLPGGASRAQAFAFINNLKNNITVDQFEDLTGNQQASALSPLPQTTESGENVYNFAIARVRRNGTMLSADNVRVFFRIFTSQTTAALTYNESAGLPVEGYLKNPGTAPGTNHIALPGISGGQWLSFPCFSQERNANRDAQVDSENIKTIDTTESEEFFGVLLDTNLGGNYLPSLPGGAGAESLQTLLVGEHQCLVAQIEFAGTPIPSGANPGTSDKLAQRNIALSEVANPGIAASRAAIHTFEIEATPYAITDLLPPDELLLEWSRHIPDDSFARIHIPSWNAEDVVALADRFYPRHEIRAVDTHTVEIPGGGMRYIPIPKCIYRQTGVLTVELPLGIKRGQRFDVSVRQITNRGRNVKFPQPKVKQISLQEAGRMLAELGLTTAANDHVKKGVFDLGKNRALVTDLSVFDTDGDFALIIQHPDPKKVAAAHADARMWRETLGAFQLGIPVSIKRDMLLYHLRLFSLMSWRLAKMSRKSRWHATMTHYVGLLFDKVQALGGNPWQIPATPDGVVPQLPWVGGGGEEGGGEEQDGGPADPTDPFFEPGDDDWLGETSGLGSPGAAKARFHSGKISGLLFDHFGDFEGFTLEASSGTHRRFFSRETAILDLASTAWEKRHIVTVITVSAPSRHVRRLLIRGYAD